MFSRCISPKIFRNICKKGKILQMSFHTTSNLLLANGENIKNALFVPLPDSKPKPKRKVTIVGGAGFVGRTIAYNIVIGKYADEIILFDTKTAENKLKGEMIDIGHLIAIDDNPRVHITTNIDDTKNSEVVIITAGAASKDNRNVAQANCLLFKDIVPPLAKKSPDCVFIILTSPCEILTYATWKLSGFDSCRCIGTGTEIDCFRFKFHLSKRLGTNPMNIDAYIIGEHGVSSVPIWSTISVGGVRLRELDPTVGDVCNDENDWTRLHTNVTITDKTIIKLKGYTNWDCSYVTERIARAVLTDAHTVHCVSMSLRGHYGIEHDCFASFPAVLGNNGIKKMIKIHLTSEEETLLKKSCTTMEEVLKSCKI